MHETYDLTNLETKVNTKWYMRWHTTFSHNTSVLCENVVSVRVENSFQHNPSMIMENKNFKTMHPTNTGTVPMHVMCHYQHHRPSYGIASEDRITAHVVLFPGTLEMRA